MTLPTILFDAFLIGGLALIVAVALWQDGRERGPEVGCDCNDDCPDCRDVRREQL